MHSPSRLWHLWEIVEGSRHASAMEQNLCHLLHLVSCMKISTQLLALVHLLSRCYAPATHPECRRQNPTAISRTIGGMLRLSFLSKLSSFKVTPACFKLYKNFTYTPYVVSCPDPTQLTRGEGAWCHKSKSLASSRSVERPIKSQSSVYWNNAEARTSTSIVPLKACYDIQYPTLSNL